MHYEVYKNRKFLNTLDVTHNKVDSVLKNNVHY
jgi:hypothetical protein